MTRKITHEGNDFEVYISNKEIQKRIKQINNTNASKVIERKHREPNI